MDNIEMQKNKVTTENGQFDVAVADAFKDAPACGAMGTFNDLSRRRMINDILVTTATADTPSYDDFSTRKLFTRSAMFGLAAGFLGICAVSAFLWWQISASQSSASETYFGEITQIEGQLLIDNTTAQAHAPVPVGKTIYTTKGAALLRLPTGIDWWMAKNTESQIESLSPSHIRIAAQSGENWFRVDPKRKGPSLSIKTPMGRIDVTGTIFVVDSQPSEVRVTLLKGQVLVTPASGHQYFIDKGNTILLRDGTQHPIASDEKSRLSAQLRALEWDTTAIPTAVNIADDTAASAAPDTELLVKPSPPVPAPKPAPMTVASLLNEIQKQRKKRNWSRVENLYKRLIQLSPDSETAIVSRVSLGEIYLTRLNRYKSALLYFEKYIRSGHSALLPEASYGRCKAYKRLGRENQELQCLDDFVQRFGTAFQASEAQSRLDILQSRNQ